MEAPPEHTALVTDTSSPESARPPPRRRRGAMISFTVKVLGLTLVFALAATGGALLHVGLRAPRELARLRVNDLLAATFQGKLILHQVDHLDLGGVEGVDAEVLDPEGVRALYLRGVAARLDTLDLVRSLFGSDIDVRLHGVRVGVAEVALRPTSGGDLGLARAFASRSPSDEPSTSTLAVHVDDVHIEHAWVRGSVGEFGPIDADLDAVDGAVEVTRDSDVRIDVARGRLEGRSIAGVVVRGDWSGALGLPHDDELPAVTARFDGTAGGALVTVDAMLDHDRADAIVSVDAPSVDGVRAFIPESLALRGPLPCAGRGARPHRRRARDGGRPPGTLHVGLLADADLPLRGESEWSASLLLRAEGVDLAEIVRDGPPSNIGAALEARAVFGADGRFSGAYRLSAPPGVVALQVIPRTTLEGTFANDGVDGHGTVDEIGAPTVLGFSLRRGGAPHTPTVVELRALSSVRELGAIPRIAGIARGRALAAVSGTLDLDELVLRADARGFVSSLSLGGVSVGRAEIKAAAHGPIASPDVDASVRGTSLLLAGWTFEQAGVSVRGRPNSFDVTTHWMGGPNTPSVSARGHVGGLMGGGIQVTGALAEIERGEAKAAVEVPFLSVGRGVTTLRGAAIKGLGTEPIKVDGELRGEQVSVRASAVDVDLARVNELLARKEDILGHVAFTVDGTFGPYAANGRVKLDAVGVTLAGLAPATAHVDLKAAGRRLEGLVDVDVPEVGEAHVVLDHVEVGGRFTDATAWRRSTGRVDIDGSFDVARMWELLPYDLRRHADASGRLAVNATISRDGKEALPSALVELVTEGLTIHGEEPQGPSLEGTPLTNRPWSVSGIDLAVGASLDGSSGRVNVKTRVSDVDGELAVADVTATPALRRLLEGSWGSLDLRALPVDGHLEIGAADVARIPIPGGLPVRGEVTLIADYSGPVASPKFALHAVGKDLSARGAACGRTMTLTVDAAYDGEHGKARVIGSTEGRDVVTAMADVDLDVHSILAPTSAPLAWTASSDIALTRFPLDALGPILSTRLGGELSGAIAVAGLHEDAEVEARLQATDVQIDRGTIPAASLEATIRGGAVNAKATLDQSDGKLVASAKGSMKWGDAVVPTFDVAEDVEIGVRAERFRISALAVLVEDVVGELDGLLDADAKIRVRQGGKDGVVDGTFDVRDGAFDLPQVGERFHDVRAKITMKPWGTVRIDDFAASAPTGKMTGSGNVVLRGLALESAEAKVTIAKGEAIPITVEGVPFGRAYGELNARATASEDGKELRVALNVPLLQVQLPQSIGHGVQALEPKDEVRIGFYDGSAFVPLPLAKPKTPKAPQESTRVVAQIDLGPDIGIKRDTTLDVAIRGRATVEVDDDTRVTGAIRVTRGKLELEGRVFTIDRGEVSFTGGDPSNPWVAATAHWDSPNKTRVYADFTGTPTAGKLTLRSDPALSQDEILSLVLTGTPNGQIGASAPPGQEENTGVQAVGMAGGVVTEGLNKILSGFTSSVTTRIDSSDANNPQPQVVVQITKNISASLGYKLGVPAPGDNPDRAELTLDWRFVKNWNLTAAVGDQGSTALDVEWRYHY
ncbi:MAG: translocation/assembly module TamB domain-containing protein [Polyangiaceae bacterium]